MRNYGKSYMQYEFAKIDEIIERLKFHKEYIEKYKTYDDEILYINRIKLLDLFNECNIIKENFKVD